MDNNEFEKRIDEIERSVANVLSELQCLAQLIGRYVDHPGSVTGHDLVKWCEDEKFLSRHSPKKADPMADAPRDRQILIYAQTQIATDSKPRWTMGHFIEGSYGAPATWQQASGGYLYKIISWQELPPVPTDMKCQRCQDTGIITIGTLSLNPTGDKAITAFSEWIKCPEEGCKDLSITQDNKPNMTAHREPS